MISGSENPGHIFFWEKQTEAIVQMIVADIGGVVNCLEPHPSVPILATSGLADEIKLWHPSKHKVNFPSFLIHNYRKTNELYQRLAGSEFE